MKRFTKELGPGWITLVENDDYALCRLIFGDGLEVDADEEETPLLKKGFQQIQEYWTGHRVIFTLPLAPGGSDFEREVWETVIRIPYGETRSYRQIAEAVGNPAACRAVGMANHCNPIPFVIPCHRVVGTNGSLTGYAGGLEMKRKLLAAEEAVCLREGEGAKG